LKFQIARIGSVAKQHIQAVRKGNGPQRPVGWSQSVPWVAMGHKASQGHWHVQWIAHWQKQIHQLQRVTNDDQWQVGKSLELQEILDFNCKHIESNFLASRITLKKRGRSSSERAPG